MDGEKKTEELTPEEDVKVCEAIESGADAIFTTDYLCRAAGALAAAGSLDGDGSDEDIIAACDSANSACLEEPEEPSECNTTVATDCAGVTVSVLEPCAADILNEIKRRIQQPELNYPSCSGSKQYVLDLRASVQAGTFNPDAPLSPPADEIPSCNGVPPSCFL